MVADLVTANIREEGKPNRTPLPPNFVRNRLAEELFAKQTEAREVVKRLEEENRNLLRERDLKVLQSKQAIDAQNAIIEENRRVLEAKTAQITTLQAQLAAENARRAEVERALEATRAELRAADEQLNALPPQEGIPAANVEGAVTERQKPLAPIGKAFEDAFNTIGLKCVNDTYGENFAKPAIQFFERLFNL